MANEAQHGINATLSLISASTSFIKSTGLQCIETLADNLDAEIGINYRKLSECKQTMYNNKDNTHNRKQHIIALRELLNSVLNASEEDIFLLRMSGVTIV